jgi:anti-sigma factor RsiW
MTDPGTHLDDELQDFIDGRLTPDKVTEVESHINHCKICRSKIDALQKAKQAAAGAAEIPVSSDLRKKIIDSLNQEDASQKKKND